MKGQYIRTPETREKLSKSKTIHGRYLKTFTNKCLDCGKKIDPMSKRCHKCNSARNIKERPKIYCLDCKKELSRNAYYYGYTKCSKCSKIGRLNKFKGTKRPEITGKNNPNYKERIERFCSSCNKSVLVSEYRDKRSKNIFCSKQCLISWKKTLIGEKSTSYGIRRFGEENPNWRGGISFEPYPLGWTKTFREQIRYRDGYKCQMCGVHEVDCNRKLSVHHIDYNKLNLSENNLVSLCVKCHCKTNGNREYWKRYFSLHSSRGLS